MKFIDHKDQGIEVDLTTVTLAHDPQMPTRLVPFFCCKCGKFIGQHTGYTFRISDSDPGLDLGKSHPVFITQCKNCFHKYLITNIL